MFRSLPPATYGSPDPSADINVTNLEALANAMVSDRDPADPKDGRDDEESGIPALYTYFGQFVDHDLTFDPASTLQEQNDPSALVNFRTPAFDLDNVYGRGPDDQPYMYQGDSMTFLLGAAISGGNVGAHDLARNTATPARALIGDPRNDENSIVSQFQGLFHRFHNRMVAENDGLSFGEIQQLVRFHYQYVILNDFLPRIVNGSVLGALKTNGRFDSGKLKFFHWKHAPFMPVEFSVAAYRLGHSMIRPGYRLNDATLLSIFPDPPDSPNGGLGGFKALDPSHGIDWGRFIDIELRNYGDDPAKVDPANAAMKNRLQFAYRIDTALVDPLKHLPPAVAVDPSSLALRNLLRGLRLGLPSGQAVAKAMGVIPLSDKQIGIGQATVGADLKSITTVNPVFTNNCPLWTYVLAEAAVNQVSIKIPVIEDVEIMTPQLGPVGGRIVAETFLGLMFGDANSMLTIDPAWTPPTGPDYKLKDIVSFAL